MATGQPFFSIVIACYNYGHTLPRALDSAFIQQAASFEVIVIDDGSTDNTGAVVKARKEADTSYLRYIWQENQKAAAAYTRGFREAAGKYVVLLDADDELEQDALFIFQSAITGAKRAVEMVIAGHYSVFPNGRSKYSPPPARLPASPEGRFKACLRHRLNPCHGAFAIARDSFLAIAKSPIPGQAEIDYARLFAYLECVKTNQSTARIHKHAGSARHNPDISLEKTEAYISSLFAPGVLPAHLRKYEREFRARRYLSYFRTLYRAGEYAAAAHCWSRAASWHLRSALSPSYLRKRIVMAGKKR